MTAIQIRGLGKVYRGGTRALQTVDLDVSEGEVVAVVGESGCGKSTMLRVVAGLEDATEGTVALFDHQSPATGHGAHRAAGRGHGLPGPRTVSPSSCTRQRRVRTAWHARRRKTGPRVGSPRPRGTARPRQPLHPRAIRRAAPTGGPCPGTRARPTHRATRRAALEPRRASTRRPARRHPAPPPRARYHGPVTTAPKMPLPWPIGRSCSSRGWSPVRCARSALPPTRLPIRGPDVWRSRHPSRDRPAHGCAGRRDPRRAPSRSPRSARLTPTA